MNQKLFLLFLEMGMILIIHGNVPENIYNDFKKSDFSNRYYYQNIKHKYNKKIDFSTDEDHKYLNFSKYDQNSKNFVLNKIKRI